MTRRELTRMARLGEDSGHQFKADVRSADSLASELVAFSNSSGGVILIGVADDGTVAGLPPEDVSRVNQLIGNAATQNMRSPISPVTENVRVAENRVVIVVRVAVGIDKPYFDRHGVIWVKVGSDKRRIQSKEELRRLFQSVDLVHADEVPTQAGLDAVDSLRLRDFVRENYNEELPDSDEDRLRLLNGMNLATGDRLNLAGLLLFGEKPQRMKPAFMLKAVQYPGTEISSREYLDSEDLEGPLSAMFEGAMSFLRRTLPKRAKGGGVNAPARWPVPEIVFEELLVNALIHRDYFVEAPIRVFVFDDRVEIVSPGSLPNHLTVEKIRAGNSVIRNPILASFVAKGLLPYRGLGTGIRRALAEWDAIELRDDPEACSFTATVGLESGAGDPESDPRKPSNEPRKADSEPTNALFAPDGEPITGTDERVVRQLLERADMPYDELAEALAVGRSTIMRSIRRLKARKVLHWKGAKKKGRWEVLARGSEGRD